MPFRAPSDELLVDDERLEPMLDELERGTDPGAPLLVRIGALRDAIPRREHGVRELATAVLGWAAPFRDLPEFRAGIDEIRALLASLRRDDARLSLATAHSTKGAEFDHVAVIGLEVGRFPSGLAVTESSEPERAMDEERRLGYVAWTRARRTLTLSYDPAVPSPFLLEAFTAEELAVEVSSAR